MRVEKRSGLLNCEDYDSDALRERNTHGAGKLCAGRWPCTKKCKQHGTLSPCPFLSAESLDHLQMGRVPSSNTCSISGGYFYQHLHAPRLQLRATASSILIVLGTSISYPSSLVQGMNQRLQLSSKVRKARIPLRHFLNRSLGEDVQTCRGFHLISSDKSRTGGTI